jgi:hypothetical protein
MLGRTSLEFHFSAIDNHGPNQIPIFENPQGCKAYLTEVLVQLPVTPGKNKGALYDAPGSPLRGWQGGFASLNHAFRYISPRSRKMGTGKSKFEKRKLKFETGN